MPHNTKPEETNLKTLPAVLLTDVRKLLLSFLQLNSMAMSGGIYQYDEVKITLFFSFTRETVYPYFYPAGIDVMVQSLI